MVQSEAETVNDSEQAISRTSRLSLLLTCHFMPQLRVPYSAKERHGAGGC